MNSGDNYIEKILTELAENSYGSADTDYFTKASYLLHLCVEDARGELNNVSKQPVLTPDEAWVMDEIKSFHEAWEHHDNQYDGMLRSLVHKISNILNPTVPTVYDKDSDLPELKEGKL